ncbi:MAG TPA: hypothetical protein VMR49_00955 [Candidatus Paceibacterota bacterium]|nr:hypothetical protein [Candidatus Paceibacterota bacterium]
MNSETKICQNCKNNFIIELDDFSFYEKIKVPLPTFCFECRTMRRIQFRNERSLYHFTCGICGKKGITMYHQNSSFPIYCINCWYSDNWDPLSFGLKYDFSKSFFEQLKELNQKVPRPNLFNRNCLNSEYSNIIGESKNLYLSFSVNNSENIFFCKSIDRSKDVFDSLSLINSNLCYENIRGENNYNSSFLILCRNCIDSSFLFDCIDCQNCFCSVGLRNKKYVFNNIQLNEKEYKEKIKTFDFGSFRNIQKTKEEFENIMKKFPRKYAQIIKSTSSTGDELSNAKNAKMSFDAYNIENTKNIFRCYGSKDCYEGNNIADCELIYEFSGGGANNSYNLLFANNGLKNLRNVFYSDFCASSSDLFGCTSLKSNQFCILNRQYTKEEYEELVPKIIKHMNDMPYIDSKGRIYKYGEFFPSELSPFCYNETIAQEYFPLTKEQALNQGYKWKDKEERNYEIDIYNKDIPDNIKDITDDIIGKVIECNHKGTCNQQCTEAFKIIPEELQFYKRMNLPLPHLCPNCRHYERLAQRNPMKLWHRSCMCDKTTHIHQGKCQVEFETSYAPERPEIIYCEKCYQQEVY